MEELSCIGQEKIDFPRAYENKSNRVTSSSAGERDPGTTDKLDRGLEITHGNRKCHSPRACKTGMDKKNRFLKVDKR